MIKFENDRKNYSIKLNLFDEKNKNKNKAKLIKWVPKFDQITSIEYLIA